MSKSDSYTVGFAKPPKHGRFVKGHSGNPRGRPKGAQNYATIVDKTLREPVEISRGGKTRTVTTFEVGMMQLANKAAAGDLKAIREIHNWLTTLESFRKSDLPIAEPTETDAIVMSSIINRIREAEEPSATEDDRSPDRSTDEEAKD